MDYPIHPAANVYPLMPDDDLARMVEDMKRNGFDKRFPIALLDGHVIDGRNRLKAAELANLKPITIALPGDTNPEEYVMRANEHRRHLQSSWLSSHRAARLKRIAEANANGSSTREIAQSEGISQTQVQRDLEKASAPKNEENPPKSTQNSLNRGDGSKAEKPTPKPDPEPPKDELDFPVPQGLVGVFKKAKEFNDCIRKLNEIKKVLEELPSHPAGACVRLQAALIDLKNLKETIKFDKPYAVCPMCKGISKSRKSNCACKDRGWLTKGAYGNLPQEHRQ